MQVRDSGSKYLTVMERTNVFQNKPSTNLKHASRTLVRTEKYFSRTMTEPNEFWENQTRTNENISEPILNHKQFTRTMSEPQILITNQGRTINFFNEPLQNHRNFNRTTTKPRQFYSNQYRNTIMLNEPRT